MFRDKIATTIICVSVIALGSGASHAKSAATNTFITIPDSRPGYVFSLTALALKPGANNLNYVIYNKGLPLQSPNWTERELRPSYSSAFALGTGYLFQEGKDVNLDWTHLNSTTGGTTVTPNSLYFLGPDYEIGPTGIPIRSANSHAQFKYDVIHLDAGQSLSFGNYLVMRFFGGLSNTYLREQITTTYSGNTIGTYSGPFSTRQQVTANFTGIGPRFGLDANVNLDSNFGILGEAAASALIGTAYSKTTYISSSQQLLVVYNQAVNHQYIQDQNVTQVIPGFDAKLAASYKHAFNQGSQLTIKAGYEAAVYINAISQYLPASLVAGQPLESGGIFVETMNHTLSNYSVQGPYLEAIVEL